MKNTILAAATSVALLAWAGSTALAQQGTTLAGPAQGSKADGSSSTQPSAESGANRGAMTRGGASGEGDAMSTGSGATSGTATTR